ncbi:MAG: hypothetical protein A2675_02440 [Candidatus Yonathbacteria bacterium RIFCSPHIGHO2_01_FULL_51_10]|uniref:Uncharacterized protein n=1 Tax=Candidatus Yonathbacteria bacterium RIFCSPHIGHO2_01_FULL_51_10 TaxID=1802723 RepID=A0A1G2S6J2_9BACT|nr:MAG: hypothetical protein A2675_02440 [Candidatus Yonathbacteria bacterium RIFCSPHIGHO2_01_FULL_51_10]
MATTIQVQDDTKQLLDIHKPSGKTYDEFIKEIVREKFKVPKSMYGAYKGKLGQWTKKDRMEDRDEKLYR